jgi:hypothetical protein
LFHFAFKNSSKRANETALAGQIFLNPGAAEGSAMRPGWFLKISELAKPAQRELYLRGIDFVTALKCLKPDSLKAGVNE